MFSDILLSLSNTNLPILHFLPFRICFILKDLSTKKSSIRYRNFPGERRVENTRSLLDVNLKFVTSDRMGRTRSVRPRNGGRISLKCGTGDRGSRTRRSIADVELHRPLPPTVPSSQRLYTVCYREQPKRTGSIQRRVARRLSGSMNDFRAALPRYVCILHPLLLLASRVLSFPAVYY